MFTALSCISLSTADAQVKADQGENGPVINKRAGLLERSTLLASGRHWAMIPKTALIYLPERYKSKVVSKPQGKLLKWSEFVKKNSGWIHTHEVKLSQARGLEIVDPKVVKAYKTMGKIVIATYQKNPITVKAAALVPPEEK